MTSAQERKQQERTARRRRIQRAARTVFAERGYAKTSIEAVAKEASLSVGAIYLYFRSKEDLYISLLEDTLELLSAELLRIGSSDEADKLAASWKFLCTWAQNDTEATRVLRLCSQDNVRKQLSDEVAEAIKTGFERIRARLADVLKGRTAATGATAADTATATDGADDSVDSSTGQLADVVWALFVGLLQTHDAKSNFDVGGPDLATLSQSGLAVLVSSFASTPLPRAAA